MNERLRYAGWRAARRLGWPGLAGSVLLALAAALYIDASSRARANHVTREQIAESQARRVPTAPPAQAHTAPETGLPGRRELPGILGELAQLASQAQVDLSETRYEFLSGGSAGVDMLELRIRSQSRYVPLRTFVATALSTIPSLAMREVDLRRVGPQADDLQVELRFALVFDEAAR